MIDIDANKILEELDGGKFKKFSDAIENWQFHDTVDKIVTSENDKYPNSLEGCMNFPKVHITRKKSKITGSNVLRIFESKKNPSPMAQYSYPKEGILYDSDIKAIKDKQCTVYLLCHTDMDGDASGSLVFNSLHYGDNIKILRFNYNYKDLDELILKVNVDKAQHPEKRFILFIVDLSPKMLYMTMLLSTFNKVVWIDHHIASIPTLSELESGNFLKTMKKNCITSDFSYVIDTRLSATHLALLWLQPYIPRVKKTKLISGFKIASLITVYDMKKDKDYPETYKNAALYLNQYYWDYQTLYVFTVFWKDAFMQEHEIETITRMLVSGKRLWDINQEKLRVLYTFDFVYKYKVTYQNGKTLTIRAIYGTGNNARFMERSEHTENDYEITMLIRYTNTPAILSASAYTSDELVKEMGVNTVFGEFGLGQGHTGAAGMRISRHDMLKLGTESIFKVVDNIPYFEANESYDNPKIEIGLKHFDNFSIKKIHTYKREINNQFAAKDKIHNMRFEPEIDIFVRTFTLIFATMFSFKAERAD